ncbi:hypothetical protein SHVI106290_00640 [Shewanella violacea]
MISARSLLLIIFAYVGLLFGSHLIAEVTA